MESESFAPVTVDFRARAMILIAVGLALATVDAVSEGVGREARDVIVGGLLFGLFTHWATWRSVNQALAVARLANGISVEPATDTWYRGICHGLIAAVFFLAADLVFRNTGSLAGFAVGAGVAMDAVAMRVSNWQENTNARLLRAMRPAHSLRLSWNAGIDASTFRIAPLEGRPAGA